MVRLNRATPDALTEAERERLELWEYSSRVRYALGLTRAEAQRIIFLRLLYEAGYWYPPARGEG